MSKIIVNSNSLVKAMAKIKGTVPNNPMLPVLENFLVEVRNNIMTITASDLQITAKTTLGVDGDDVEACLPAKIALSTLKALPNQPITLNFDDEGLFCTIESDNGKYKVATELASDFPKTEEPEEIESIEMDAETFGDILSSTVFACSSDEMKLPMTGVNIQSKDGAIHYAATDAHKLVHVVQEGLEIDYNVIVPSHALSQVHAMLPSNGTVDVSFSESSVVVDMDGDKVIARLLEERYPDYENVIPFNNDKQVVIDRAVLVDALKRIAIYANKSTNQVVLSLANNNLVVSAEDIDFQNEANESLFCQYEGDKFQIGFNAAMLSMLLTKIADDRVVLSFSEPNRAALITPENQIEGFEVTMLLMPVMLHDYA